MFKTSTRETNAKQLVEEIHDGDKTRETGDEKETGKTIQRRVTEEETRKYKPISSPRKQWLSIECAVPRWQTRTEYSCSSELSVYIIAWQQYGRLLDVLCLS